VPLRNQIYLGLPDGGLDHPDSHLDKLVTEAVDDIRPARIFTTGTDGYDGHTDHIAMHEAGVRAGRDLSRLGHEVVVWALDSRGMGEMSAYGNLHHKLGSMTLHVSQDQGPDLVYWGGTDLYAPVILGPETYDRVA
jgi:LmbE family N-acetylglucosaminyl deacetylase